MKVLYDCIIFIFLIGHYTSLMAASQTDTSWLANLSVGYNSYKNMLYDDGEYASLRLGFGKDLIVHKHNHFGVEFGIETGNTMRLNLPKSILDQLGGLPFQLKLKPIADLMATAKLQPKEVGISVLFNAGIA